ncbi:MAG: class I SAM-dependent methyltransferase, partial [Planctomycetota bacterium]
GVDLSTEMIREAKLHFPDQEFAAGDFYDLPFEDDTFAGCLAFYCIVHLQPEQLVNAFAEMRRVLKPNGLLLLAFHIGTEPVHNEDFLDAGAALTFFPFPVDVVTSALTAAGFKEALAREREPYETEYPSQRCYVFARKTRTC